MEYVSLHHHTTFSYMDGVKTPLAHFERSAELGMAAQAVTEHGNVSSHVGAEKAAAKTGVKAIFGLEAYTHPDPESRRKFHLTLLAADQTGYRNLMRIVSRSWAEGFHQWPTVSGQMLADHSDGIICLSGCSDSLLACSLLGGKTIDPADSSFKSAQRVATNFRALYGDRYYLECQMFPELERTRQINAAYERLSSITGIPLVGTADVHYPDPDDNVLQTLVHAAGRGNNTAAQQAESWEYDIRLTLPTSDKMVLKRLRGAGLSKSAAGLALASTVEIADRCNVVLPKADRFRYPVDDPRVEIWSLLREGWAYRKRQGWKLAGTIEEYRARVEKEMGLIEAKDFVDYFLMISDIVRWAKDHGIPVGPARGSAAASLVCYLLRITEIDPLAYPLMYFERFIAPDREDLPDIDLDFDDDRRSEVRAYAVSRYGEERVANIGTFTQYKGRNSIDDVARVYRIPKSVAEELKGMVVERSGGDSRSNFALADSIEMFPAAAAIIEQYPDLLLATRLEGSYRGMSTHAAGLVVTNSPVTDVCAMYTREDKQHPGQQLTAVSVDKKDAEYLGLMKVDLLGLSTMGMIRLALEHAGLTLEELYRIPTDDPETLAAFRENDVIGIFQFEGRATRIVCRNVKPDNFLELADINGLSRPGPLFSGTTGEYVETKHGRMEMQTFHPVVDKHTRLTKGQIIYQEQVLAILGEFGGLPVRRVHDIRRIISQKLGEAQFNESADDFADGAARLHGVDRDLAKTVWARLVTSATYSFNIAHCVSYSLLAFWSMWLKVHHPTAFYLAQLRKSDKEKWPRLIRDAEAHGVVVKGVTLGQSGLDWSSPMSGQIVAGYEQLNGVGESIAPKIVEFDVASRRAGGPGLRVAEDLLGVYGIGEAKLRAMRHQINSEDPFGLRRVSEALASTRKAIKNGELPVRAPTHTSSEILDAAPGQTVTWLGLVRLKEYKDIIEDQRARTGQSPDEIRASLRRPDLATFVTLHCYDDEDEDVYMRIHRLDFPKFARACAAISIDRDLVHVIANKSRGGFGASLYVKGLTVIEPD